MDLKRQSLEESMTLKWNVQRSEGGLLKQKNPSVWASMYTFWISIVYQNYCGHLLTLSWSLTFSRGRRAYSSDDDTGRRRRRR